MSRLLEELVSGVVVSGEEISTSLTINGSAEVYTLIEERGDGGQGTLYKALRGEQTVAVKILDRKPKLDERERFAFWQNLDDVSGVTHLLAHGASSLELKNYAVVSEYVDGVNLEQLRARGPLTEETVREILLQSATILGNIHTQKVLHRDIKPSNIMVDRSGDIYITDFGAARDAEIQTLTGTVAMGTLLYVAPEQYQGKPTPASDLHSLGLTMYYLMRGEHPPMMIALHEPRKISFGEIEGYSPQLVSVVRKMCEHDTTRRYANASAVLDALTDNTLLVPTNISDLEQRVRERRNFALGSVAATVSGSLVAYLGNLELGSGYTVLGYLSQLFGVTMALTGFASYGAFGHLYWAERKKLQAAREKLQLEGRVKATALVAPESGALVPTPVLSREDVRRKKSLENEIARYETLIKDHNTERRFGMLSATIGLGSVGASCAGIVAHPEAYLLFGTAFTIVGFAKAGYNQYRISQDTAKLETVRIELELLVEQNSDVRNLLIQKRALNQPNTWWGDALQHSISLLATVDALYTTVSGSAHQALINTCVAAGIYVTEKAGWGYFRRSEKKDLDDRISALRKLSETASLEMLTTERGQGQLEIRKQAAQCIGSTAIVTPLFGAFALANYLGYTTPISTAYATIAAVGMPIIQTGRYYFTTRSGRKKRRELDFQVKYLSDARNRTGIEQTYTPAISKTTEFGFRDQLYYRTMYESVYTQSFKSNDYIMFGNDMKIRIFRKRFGEETIIISEESRAGQFEQLVYKLPFSAEYNETRIPNFNERERLYTINLINNDFCFDLILHYETKELHVQSVRRP